MDFCSICYENCKIIRLKCKHEMCKQCIKRLVQATCPYCRCDITLEVRDIFEQKLKILEYKPEIPLIRIRCRRRRRRRSKEERMVDRQVLNIVLEDSKRGRKEKRKKGGKLHIDKKKQKYKQSRKGRWNGLNRQRNF